MSLAKQIIDHLPEIRKSLGKAVVSKDEFMETAVSVIASKDGRPHFGLSDVLTKNSKRLLRILAAYMEVSHGNLKGFLTVVRRPPASDFTVHVAMDTFQHPRTFFVSRIKLMCPTDNNS